MPHWYDDVVRLGAARLSTKPYEWPEPELLKSRGGPQTKKEAEEAKVKAMGVEEDPMKRSVYTTVVKYTNVLLVGAQSPFKSLQELVAAGIAVDAFTPRRRLEDAFLALVGEGS